MYLCYLTNDPVADGDLNACRWFPHEVHTRGMPVGVPWDPKVTKNRSALPFQRLQERL